MNDFLINHYGVSNKPTVADEQTPLRQILEERMKQSIQPQDKTITAPKQVTCSVDGYTLPADIMSVIVYTLIKTLGKQAAVRKVLKQFNFTFKDLTGKQIYPTKIAGSKKKKR